MCAKNLTLWRHEQIDVLKHVKEELIPPVFDALATPADLTCDLVGDLSSLLLRLRFNALLCDVGFQDANVRVLWVAKIKDFLSFKKEKKYY